MYAKIKNGKVIKFPYSTSDLYKDNKNTSFPDKLSKDVYLSHNLVEVKVKDQPDYDRLTQTLSLKKPELVNNEWVTEFEVKDKI